AAGARGPRRTTTAPPLPPPPPPPKPPPNTTRAEGPAPPRAPIPAATIVALAIAPRTQVVGAHLAPPNGIGSPRLAPALVAACRFPLLLGRCRRPRGRRRRSGHLSGLSRCGFDRVRLWAGMRARRGGHGFVRALRRSDAADGDCSNRRAVGFDPDRPGLARLAGNAFAVEIDPGAME